MTYYNIYIHHDKKENKYEYDIDSYEKLIAEYIKPYLKENVLFINGSFISKTPNDTIQIRESEVCLLKLYNEKKKKYANWESELKIIWNKDPIDYYQHNATKPEVPKLSNLFFDDNITTNVTNEIIKKIQKEIGEENSNAKKEEKLMPKEKSNEVFIVHGHDEGLLDKVKGIIYDLGMAPIILHELADGGKTIIEKFENKAPKTSYAIILYTPCDEGRKKDNGNLKARARQNVILEHGYFIGKFGRKNVAAIVKGDVEKPSDIDGLLYITYSDDRSLKSKLAKEMINVGIDIDSTKAL